MRQMDQFGVSLPPETMLSPGGESWQWTGFSTHFVRVGDDNRVEREFCMAQYLYHLRRAFCPCQSCGIIRRQRRHSIVCICLQNESPRYQRDPAGFCCEWHSPSQIYDPARMGQIHFPDDRQLCHCLSRCRCIRIRFKQSAGLAAQRGAGRRC